MQELPGFSGKAQKGLIVFVLTVFTAAPAAALDTLFAGPRAMGMAGANVASVSDTTAQYYNPAAFGFFGRRQEDGSRTLNDNNNIGRKDWGADLNAALGYRLHNGFGGYLATLGDIDLDQLSTGVSSQSDLADLINLVSSLEGIDRPGSAVTTDATVGLGIRAGHFAIGARGFLQATGMVEELDRENLGLDIPAAQLHDEMITIPMDDAYSSTDYQFQVFTEDQRLQLAGAFGVATDDEAIKRLDYVAAQEGIKSGDVAGAVDLLEGVIASSGEVDGLDNNTTSVLLSGFGLAEVPLSYGYAINDILAVGVNVKLMRGRVYGNSIVVFDDEADEILSQTTERYEESNNFGVDIGMLARFPKFNLGIIGRNLNSPSFDGFTDSIELTDGQTREIAVKDVKIKPQVTAGVAFIPFTTLTVEADLDLTENETALAGYHTRNLSLGMEWDALRFLALRAGAYKNLSESDIGWVYTAGLGLNLWAARLDVAGAFTGEKDEFQDDEIPRETRLAAQFSVDF